MRIRYFLVKNYKLSTHEFENQFLIFKNIYKTGSCEK